MYNMVYTVISSSTTLFMYSMFCSVEEGYSVESRDFKSGNLTKA